MAKKVQSQLLVPERTRDRADALALVMREPRAEVYRMALEGSGLKGLERDYREELATLAEIARDIGTGVPDLVRRMLADGYALADLQGRKRYPTPREA